jgi:hypothetical protein
VSEPKKPLWAKVVYTFIATTLVFGGVGVLIAGMIDSVRLQRNLREEVAQIRITMSVVRELEKEHLYEARATREHFEQLHEELVAMCHAEAPEPPW